jgi:hypothetical protein
VGARARSGSDGPGTRPRGCRRRAVNCSPLSFSSDPPRLPCLGSWNWSWAEPGLSFLRPPVLLWWVLVGTSFLAHLCPSLGPVVCCRRIHPRPTGRPAVAHWKTDRQDRTRIMSPHLCDCHLPAPCVTSLCLHSIKKKYKALHLNWSTGPCCLINQLLKVFHVKHHQRPSRGSWRAAESQD